MTNLPDVQQTKPFIEMGINQVGVENVMVPLKLQLRNNNTIDMIANVSMRTNLRHNIKGISMSRLIITLTKYLNQPLKHMLIHEILIDLKDNLECDEAYIKFNFKLPIDKISPKTKNSFPIFYNCRFEGQLVKTIERGVMCEVFKFFQGVIVQYSSYCPCSAELCSHLLTDHESKGFPHAQRSFAHVLVEVNNDAYIWLEDIIETIESAIKTLPYPIIKRPDEMEIARIAAENPIFVEDAIRSISEKLDLMDGIKDWYLKCRHEESIHTSEAIAINYKGIPGGFDFRYNL